MRNRDWHHPHVNLPRSRRKENGSALIVALILLVVLTLYSLSAYFTTVTDLKTVGNSQSRTEAFNAAQEAIETALSSPQFTSDPSNALIAPCGAPNTFCVDYNGDGTPEYTATLTPAPACVSMKTIKVVELNLTDSEDLSCAVSQGQQFGIAGVDTTASDSLCANTTWQLTATATAPATATQVSVTQGVGIRIGADDMSGACL